MPNVTRQVCGQAEIQTQAFWPPDWESMSSGLFRLSGPDDILPRVRKKEGWGSVFGLEPSGTDNALVGLPGPDMFCLFHGKRYSPGESWHPYLEPQGLMYCLRCTCSEVGSSGHLATCHRYVWETSREVTPEGGRTA